MSFRVGVISPESTEKSASRIVNFYTCYALDMALSLVLLSPAVMASLILGQFLASAIVFADEPNASNSLKTSGNNLFVVFSPS